MKKFNETLLKINDVVISFLKKNWFWIALGLVAACAIWIRVPLYTKKTGDFNNFLVHWYEGCYNDARAFLASDTPDYTPTYIYFLVFISWFRIPPDSINVLFAIKTVSVLFDFGSAFLIFWIFKFILKKADWITLIGVFMALFVPQIFLNSAFWGQCDSIFTFFIVLSIFFLLKKQPLWATVAFAVSFSFKLQSIFFLPVLILLWLNKKYRLWYLLIIPAVYILLCLPAMICGRSFISCMSVYFSQAGDYTYLSLNAPNIYTFMYPTFKGNESVTQHLVPAAVAFGITSTLVLGFFLFVTQKDIKDEDLIKIAYLLTLFIPFVLPKMHERYFYLAEVMAVLYLCINPKKWYISLLSIAGSFSGYNLYLFNTYYFNDANVDLLIGASMITASLILLCFDIFKGKTISFKEGENKQESL